MSILLCVVGLSSMFCPYCFLQRLSSEYLVPVCQLQCLCVYPFAVLLVTPEILQENLKCLLHMPCNVYVLNQSNCFMFSWQTFIFGSFRYAFEYFRNIFPCSILTFTSNLHNLKTTLSAHLHSSKTQCKLEILTLHTDFRVIKKLFPLKISTQCQANKYRE